MHTYYIFVKNYHSLVPFFHMIIAYFKWKYDNICKIGIIYILLIVK